MRYRLFSFLQPIASCFRPSLWEFVATSPGGNWGHRYNLWVRAPLGKIGVPCDWYLQVSAPDAWMVELSTSNFQVKSTYGQIFHLNLLLLYSVKAEDSVAWNKLQRYACRRTGVRNREIMYDMKETFFMLQDGRDHFVVVGMHPFKGTNTVFGRSCRDNWRVVMYAFFRVC